MLRRSILIALICFCLPSASAELGPEELFFSPRLTFREHHPMSNYAAVCRRCSLRPEKGARRDYNYNIEEETFGLYVPESNDPNTAYGILVDIQPGGNAEMREKYRKLLAEKKLIYVSLIETRYGDHSTYRRRIPLALDATYNVVKKYNVDRDRIYITGVSAGGRVASIMAFHYPDIFKGGIFIIGANCWKVVPVPGKKGKYWRQGMMKPQQKYLVMGRRNGRYVVLAGEKDFNRLQMHTYYEEVYKKTYKNCLYLEVPGMGHAFPPLEFYKEAIEFLDGD